MNDNTEPRKGMPSPRLAESEFKRRFVAQFQDPAFDSLAGELQRIAAAAWDGYSNSRKSPRTRMAGTGFSDPGYDLAIDWIAAHEAVQRAQQQYEDRTTRARFLLINCSSRNEHTCPGEMSKSFRLTGLAREVLEGGGDTVVDVLDLSRLTSEYGRKILSVQGLFLNCRGTLSLALPVLSKLLARSDTGAEGVRRSITDWLASMELCAAAGLDRYIGYWKPYATSHEELDADQAVQEEVRNVARALLEGVLAVRTGKEIQPGAQLHSPRDK